MHLQAKWLGLSLTLHLAAAGSLITASPVAERAPETIMVVLDNRVPSEAPLYKVQAALPKTARLAAPPIPVKSEKPVLQRQPFEPVVPQVASTIPVPGQSRIMQQPKPVETSAAAYGQPKDEADIPAFVPAAKLPLPHSVSAAEVRPAQEKELRYLKEHFAYIRDLVKQQLIYPPMAKKMRWSGRVLVAFTIAEDGSAHNIRVEESSGFPILDKRAAETVKKAAPFPKPPVRADIVLPINFKMM